MWGAFLAEFLVRLFLADQRTKYPVSHWYDVLLVLVPMLRPLRLLRLLALMRILKRSAAGSLATRAATYAVGAALTSIGLVGVITASVAAWFVGNAQRDDADLQA